jgi:transcriptional regulator with XRE-family HTH domain
MTGSVFNEKSMFAERVRKRREREGLTRQQLATAVDVKLGTIANWENAKTFAAIRIRGSLCEVLHTDLKYLCLPPYEKPPYEPDDEPLDVAGVDTQTDAKTNNADGSDAAE